MSEILKISTKLTLLESEVWSSVLPVPNPIANQLISDGGRRIICHIEGIKPYHCALLPDGNGSWYILLNKKRQLALGLSDAAEIEAVLEKDSSEYGMEMPLELKEVLNQDEHANTLFHKLTPGRMRNIIHVVSSVKSTEIRIRKALVCTEHLKKNQGKIEFKELAQEMKDANREARRSFY